VHCTTGDVGVNTVTHNIDNPSGYQVSLANGRAMDIGSTDSHIFSGLQPGSNSVLLSGIAGLF
jgi:hypothetical protein